MVRVALVSSLHFMICHRPTPKSVQVRKSVPQLGVLQWVAGRRAAGDGIRLLSSGSRSPQVTGLLCFPHSRREVSVMENP